MVVFIFIVVMLEKNGCIIVNNNEMVVCNLECVLCMEVCIFDNCDNVAIIIVVEIGMFFDWVVEVMEIVNWLKVNVIIVMEF